jgi:cysteine desulfurase
MGPERLAGVDGAELLAPCPDLAAGRGAACHAAQRKRSAVLTAMDIPEDAAFGAARFSLGRITRDSEIDDAGRMIANATA